MSAKEILVEARKLIEKEEYWVQGRHSMSIGQRNAYCLNGALCEAEANIPSITGENFIKAATLLRKVVGGDRYSPSISSWNDVRGRKHSEVLEALDKAIELASQEL